MPDIHRYLWVAVDSKGIRKKGIVYATCTQEVHELVISKVLTVRYIKRLTPPLLLPSNQKANRNEITQITKQLATMLDASLPLSTSLTLLANSHKKAQCRAILRHLNAAIISGASLSSALTTASPLFDNTYVNLVACAETSGQLALVINRIAIYREKEDKQKAKLKKVMIYPSIVLLFALTVAYLMLTVVLPQFDTMFKSLGAQLPWFTQQLITLSHWLADTFFVQLLSITSFFILFKAIMTHSPTFSEVVDRSLLKFPIVGEAISKTTLARFCSTMALSLQSGVPILTSLRQSAEVSNNCYYKLTFNQIAQRVSEGMSMHEAVQQSAIFPALFAQMILIGEQTGTLDKKLAQISSQCETELDETADKLGITIEPILILVLGLMIAGFVVAIYLPIFNLMSVIG